MQINTFDHFVQQEDTEMKKEDGRVRITRQMIRTALLNLLREKPLQHITVRELCEKASINRGTFYAHYDDIYDLMEQIEQSMFDEFKAILRPLLEDQDPYDLVETITRIFSYIREHADLCLVTLGPHSDKKLLYRLIELGKQACLNSQLSLFPHADPHMLDYYYTFVSSGCIALLEKWMNEGMPDSTDHLAAFVRTLISPAFDTVRAKRLSSGQQRI